MRSKVVAIIAMRRLSMRMLTKRVKKNHRMVTCVRVRVGVRVRVRVRVRAHEEGEEGPDLVFST